MTKQEENVRFWISQFRPRPLLWKRKTLRRLKLKVSPFETPEENRDKIQALETLLK